VLLGSRRSQGLCSLATLGGVVGSGGEELLLALNPLADSRQDVLPNDDAGLPVGVASLADPLGPLAVIHGADSVEERVGVMEENLDRERRALFGSDSSISHRLDADVKLLQPLVDVVVSGETSHLPMESGESRCVLPTASTVSDVDVCGIGQAVSPLDEGALQSLCDSICYIPE